MRESKTVTLYHGSKFGLSGEISPQSRDKCDFGKGFYMGTEKIQPQTLICNYENAVLYTVQVDLTGLEILNLDICMDWALLIALNRGRMERVKKTAIYNRVKALTNGVDMIIGYIANDRMFVVLDRFFNGEITDIALISSLSALKLGKQYVALTDKACKNIKIIESEKLSSDIREGLKVQSEEKRRNGVALAQELCIKYRREGKYFDEIIRDGD